MEEEDANSWIRRTKFSSTVCYRLNSSWLSSSPITLQKDISLSKPGSGSAVQSQGSGSNVVIIQKNPLNNKMRTVSPLPETRLPETFTEARSYQKRFSTPSPRRKDTEKRGVRKFFHREAQATKSVYKTKSATIVEKSVTRITSAKQYDKSKSVRESAWSKYFDLNGGRVTSVETPDEHEVDLSKLFLGLRFAHGAHSQLYHGVYKDESVAVKIIRVPDDDEDGALCARLENQFTREVSLLSRLHHQNVIKFVAAFWKPPVFCIMTEYLAGGSLRSYLHKLERKPLPLERLLTMALDIARGIEYIHSKGVIHRDLKPENILITDDFHLKVADFGIACEENSCDILSDDPGTYRWMAPEMIKRKHYGRKVDVYGFGLILWEFVAGTIPYENMTPIQAAFAVVNKNLRPAIPLQCPQPIKVLIEQCWSMQPDKRPEFVQIVKALKEFMSLFSRDRTLNAVPKTTLHDLKKGQFSSWIQKLGSGEEIPTAPHPKFS